MTTPTPIGGLLGEVVGRVRETQRRAERRHPGRWTPDAPDELPPRSRVQAQWEEVLAVKADDADLPRWRLDNLHVPDVGDRLAKWADGNAKVVVLYSAMSGTGKTRAAAALLHRCWAEGRTPVLWGKVADLVETWLERDSDDGRRLRTRAGRARFAVLDEMGSTRFTDHRQAALETMWDTLVDSGCRVIVTTNLNAKERETQLGSRMASRVGKQSINFPNEDLRHRGLPVPPAPPTTPCPYRCSDVGTLDLDQLPDADLRIRADLAARGRREPDAASYPSGEEGDRWLAADYEAWDRDFEHTGRSVAWCPHCHPERTA